MLLQLLSDASEEEEEEGRLEQVNCIHVLDNLWRVGEHQAEYHEIK